MDDTQTSAKYFKVKIPKEWIHSVIDPHTFEEIFMIHPKEGGYFMFEDEIEALTFKLTYL
jgi:hypothetical protein